MFTILQGRVSSKRVVLIDQRYPYGKSKTYMSTALVVVAAQLLDAGHEIRIVDFNIDRYDSDSVRKQLAWANVIGISAVGSPYIPQTIELTKKLKQDFCQATVVVGGQVFDSFTQEQFRQLFGDGVKTQAQMGSIFGSLSSPYDADLVPVYEEMGDERLKVYVSNEFPLLVGQGCIFRCSFCSAAKNQKEQFHRLDQFVKAFEFLVIKAKSFGLQQMECYATSLDFFQNPITVVDYLVAIGEICRSHQFRFRLRALCCMNTFLKAAEVLPDFEGLVQGSGLWCVGFGVDGADEVEWRRYKKTQNHTKDVDRCLSLCDRLGLRTEVLMIMGYPESTLGQMVQSVKNSIGYVLAWPRVILRPHVAKTFLPGNDEWVVQTERVQKVLDDPSLFYNLDVCALGSPVTHPRFWNRLMANLSFLVLVSLSLTGRNATSPLLPQGGSGWFAKISTVVNRFMPFDR